MSADNLRLGLLAGSASGVIGVVVWLLAGTHGTTLLSWLLYLLAPTIGGLLGAGLARRFGAKRARAELVRAGAVAGAASGICLGLLLSATTVNIVLSGALDRQVRDLFAQNGLAPDSADELSGLALGCAGCLFLLLMPALTASLGAAAAGVYSFVYPVTASPAD